MRKFLDTFRKQGIDVDTPEVAKALGEIYWGRAEGTDRIFQRGIWIDGMLTPKKANSFGMFTTSDHTAHGAKVIAKRRAKAKAARAARKVNCRAAAKLRRKRQWRQKVRHA